MSNELPFTSPYDSAGTGRFFPGYTVRHPLPENRKSQFIYLRPDLGTEIVPYTMANILHHELGVASVIGRDNSTCNTLHYSKAPKLSCEAQEYAQRWFRWDIEATDGSSMARTSHLHRDNTGIRISPDA